MKKTAISRGRYFPCSIFNAFSALSSNKGSFQNRIFNMLKGQGNKIKTVETKPDKAFRLHQFVNLHATIYVEIL
jgi:hypothetical protein